MDAASVAMHRMVLTEATDATAKDGTAATAVGMSMPFADARRLSRDRSVSPPGHLHLAAVRRTDHVVMTLLGLCAPAAEERRLPRLVRSLMIPAPRKVRPPRWMMAQASPPPQQFQQRQ